MSFPSNTPGMLGNTDLQRFDALIIGSGAGGSAAAHVLAAAGQKVLVLEAGDNHFPGLDRTTIAGTPPWPLYSNDEIKMSIRNFDFQDPLVEPRTFRQTESEVAQAHPDVNNLTRNVGGAAVISSVSYPRFTAIDFRMAKALQEAGREYSGTSFADWPLSYDELEPFYTETDVLSGIAGVTAGEGADPFQSWRSQPFPLPPQPEMYVGRVLANGAKRLNYEPFNYPSAVNTRPYDGRSPCVGCGLCTNYGCARNAKGSPAVTTLRKALLTGNCQLRYNAHVSRLVMDAARQHVVGVEYIDDDGQKQVSTADYVILAASPIESVRLCFLSDPYGPGIGNTYGHLGRHMMFHFQTIAVGIFKQRLHGERGRSITNGMGEFRGIEKGGAVLRSDSPLGGVIEFGTSSEPITAARESLQPAAITFAQLSGVSFKQLLVESPFQAHIAVMIMHGEDAPQPSNRVDLDPNVHDVFGLRVPRLTYKNHAFELDAATFYKPKMLAVLEAAGAAYGFFQPFDPSVPPTSRHIMGGLRMGDDPHESVCDRWGKFHDVDNLYCVDGSVFVTGSGYNPTPTIIALGLRTAGAIVSPGSPERVLGRGHGGR
ncbi:MAG TPA: GMC family oxidoreductase [Candidatus Margulisiibacteriota bacterium]|nr:GMC family oxidoreductase [Candidatus Margulisiibacteriota bacterium]